MNKILVTYATKHGATAEIAEKIGAVLQAAGLAAEVLPVDQVETLSKYGAVVFGSAVYAGQWRKEAISFLEANQQVFAEMPVWFFSSGPTGEGDPVALMKGWEFPEAQKPIADRIHPRAIAVFHGDLESRQAQLGREADRQGRARATGRLPRLERHRRVGARDRRHAQGGKPAASFLLTS